MRSSLPTELPIEAIGPALKREATRLGNLRAVLWPVEKFAGHWRDLRSIRAIPLIGREKLVMLPLVRAAWNMPSMAFQSSSSRQNSRGASV